MLRGVLAREGGLRERTDDKGTEHVRVLLAELSLAEVDDKNLAAVHHPAQVDGGAWLAEDVAQCRRRQDRVELVEDGRDDLAAEVVVVLVELVAPVR